MPATITGIVFDDVNHNGILDPGELGIAGAYVVRRGPGGGCATVQTNANGVYTFSGINGQGDHTIYETATNPGAPCPPTTFGQPAGFTNSTTFRTETIAVLQTDIDNNVTLTGRNYGHDNPDLFPCSSEAYQVSVPLGATNSQLTEINLVIGDVTIIDNDIGFNVNAIGYNILDNMIYGIEYGTTNLIRIAEDGVTTNFGPVINLPAPAVAYTVGTINNVGLMYIYEPGAANYFVVDVDQNSPTFGQALPPAGIAIVAQSIEDWSYNPLDGQLYTVDNTGTALSINPLTGLVTPLTTSGLIASTYGSTFMDANGFLYVLEDSTGDIYRVTLSPPNATGNLFSQSLAVTGNDGAYCQNAFPEIDFGDAPDIALGNGPGNYNTLLASNGPRHQIINTLFLGTRVTAENDAYENPTATGDDFTLGIQDDGITLPIAPVLTCDSSYSLDILITNDTGQNANLYVWIDFNQNGLFDGNEAALPVVVPSGVNPSLVTVNFNVPGPLTAGNTFLRARLTTDTLINNNGLPTQEDTRSIGSASDGEVEDYLIKIVDPTTLITSVKTADKSFVGLGETVNYTIFIPNTSAYDTSNLVLKDILPTGFSLVPGSFSVNGMVINNPNLIVGVPLGNLASGDNFIISFSALVANDPSLCGTTVSNQAFIDLQFCTGTTQTLSTNIVNVDIQCISLEVIKEADKDILIVGDTLTYTITITNTSNIALDNLVLTDKISDCASFVIDSVTLNGVKQPGVNPETGIPIGTLNPGTSVIVGFSVRLDKVCCPASLSNKALVTYEYTITIDSTEVTETGSEESNLVIVPVAPTTFKQLSKDEVVTIPIQKPDIEQIINVLVEIQIIDTRVIETIKGISIGGQKLTGYKLIIEGKINQKVEYVADEPQQSVHAAHFKVPFSSFIILPEDFQIGTNIEVEPFIEDVYYKLIDKRTLFKNTTFRLLAKINEN